ncbi:MAG: sulfurtransferase TusA family protein [Betaproteobacteria bacterium]|jgi:tRNA 2-thiouridine synthesizing protein A|nr:sulfurtransferase TusA family protein [Betaproteobacteria bacterium]
MSDVSPSTGSTADRVLDTRGLNCPMPILKAKKTLNEMTGGSLLKVLATDPGAVRDFEYFCRHTGHQLMESTEAEGEFCFLIRRKG